MIQLVLAILLIIGGIYTLYRYTKRSAQRKLQDMHDEVLSERSITAMEEALLKDLTKLRNERVKLNRKIKREVSNQDE